MKAKGPKLSNLSHSGEIAESDFKYMYEKPEGDLGFSVEHNRRVIAQSIAKNDKKSKQIQKDYDETLEERTNAAVDFLRYLANSKYNPSTDSSSKAALKYFGRRELARLRGEAIKKQIMEELKKNSWILDN